MNQFDLNQLWSMYMSDKLDAAEKTALFDAMHRNPALRDRFVLDAEVDGMLRMLGKQQPVDEDDFVAQVMDRIHDPVPDSSLDELPIAEPLRVTPPPVVSKETNASDTLHRTADVAVPEVVTENAGIRSVSAPVSRRDQQFTRWGWSLATVLAASLLFVLVIAAGQKDPNRPGRPDNSTRASADRVPPRSPQPRPNLEQSRAHPLSNPSTGSRLGVVSQPAAPDASPDANLATTPDTPTGSLESPAPTIPKQPAWMEEASFARIESTSTDAQWYEIPHEINGRVLELQHGTANLRMASGVSVSVVGPSQFRVDSHNSLIVADGKISADVPPSAIGFAVDTPSAKIVDLGTRFDVNVLADGGTSVRVKKGTVTVQGSDETNEQVLETGQERYIDDEGQSWAWQLAINADVFGEVSAVFNGEPFSSKDEDGFRDLQDVIINRLHADPQATRARYEINGKEYLARGLTDATRLMIRVRTDLIELQRIVSRAAGDSGSFNLKNRVYVYGNLREKLEARRNVARTFGTRALSNAFSEHEKFDTQGLLSDLLDLQESLNERLDIPDAVSGAFLSGQGRNRDPVVIRPQADVPAREVETEEELTRDELERRMRQILDRKRDEAARSGKPEGKSPDATPAPKIPNGLNVAVPKVLKNPESGVDAALRAELAGDNTQRRKLLDMTLEKFKDYPAAHWQAGRVKMGGNWVPLHDAMARGDSNPMTAAYERMRSELAGTAKGELQLARWAKTRRPQAAKIHYQRLIDDASVTDTSVRAEAAKALDLVLQQGAYISRSELDEQQARQEKYQLAMRRWTTPLAKWEKWTRDKSKSEQKERAKKELAEVDDIGVLLAAARYTASNNVLLGLELVDTATRFSEPEAAQFLCQLSLTTPSSIIRSSAMGALKERDLHEYVPDLLGSVRGKLVSDWQVAKQDDGTIRYEHVMRREGAMQDQETTIVRNAKPVTVDNRPDGFRGGFLRDTGQGDELVDQFTDDAEKRDREVQLTNAQIAQTNQRIFTLLTETTGQELPPEPNVWWDWWTDYNEIEIQKQTRKQYDVQSKQYISAVYEPPAWMRTRTRHSCFVAGTLVATETGMRPIESIQAGDRVFAKDIDTGQLNLKTVMMPTVRQAERTVAMRVGEEIIHTTPGHPFWISGVGWRMAKLLQPGDRLHGVQGSLTISSVEVRPGDLVYNLILDDFHNYFVGKDMVLAHDHTYRTTTGHRLPGLK